MTSDTESERERGALDTELRPSSSQHLVLQQKGKQTLNTLLELLSCVIKSAGDSRHNSFLTSRAGQSSFPSCSRRRHLSLQAPFYLDSPSLVSGVELAGSEHFTGKLEIEESSRHPAPPAGPTQPVFAQITVRIIVNIDYLIVAQRLSRLDRY